MAIQTMYTCEGDNGVIQQHALFSEGDKIRAGIGILLTLVCFCSTAAFAAKDHGGYECDKPGRENRYPPRGTKPGEIQISGRNMCSGSGANFSASGGYDCDNQMLGEAQSWGSHLTGCSNANCFYKICILEWNNASAPYAWFTSGPVFIEDTWSGDTNNLNDRAYIRSYHTVIVNSLPFTVTVTRSECTHAIELGGEPITNQWHGTVTTPPKLQRSARTHPSFGITDNHIRYDFLGAGLILRKDNDGRTLGTPQDPWNGARDQSQCVEFELHSWLNDEEAYILPVDASDDEQVWDALRAGNRTRNVVYANISNALAVAPCPGNRVLIRFSASNRSKILVHEWGHSGNIVHPNDSPEYFLYTLHPDLYTNDIMLSNAPGEWINGRYGKCNSDSSSERWEGQTANALVFDW